MFLSDKKRPTGPTILGRDGDKLLVDINSVDIQGSPEVRVHESPDEEFIPFSQITGGKYAEYKRDSETVIGVVNDLIGGTFTINITKCAEKLGLGELGAGTLVHNFRERVGTVGDAAAWRLGLKTESED